MSEELRHTYTRSKEALMREQRRYIEGGKSAETTISPKEQREYTARMKAKLAYCTHYYFSGCKDTLIGGRLTAVNLHYGFLRDPNLDMARVLGGGDPYTSSFRDYEYLDMRGGGYEPNHEYLSLPIKRIEGNLSEPLHDEKGSLLHELGHIAPLGLSWSDKRAVNTVVDELLELKDSEYRTVFGTTYGTRDYSMGGRGYDPEEETRANLYRLCTMGEKFPETVQRRLEEGGISPGRVKEITEPLQRFLQVLKKNGYLGNPEWTDPPRS